ncbi:hypothetical protein PG991_010940 [Apiospora marii]|uniref:Uncharacterized protein n=1 Tax=Apiospora marii TaxID=335849 RepID=A0ABR1RDQ2_9PEZI
MESLFLLFLTLGFLAQAMATVDNNVVPSRVQKTQDNFAASPIDMNSLPKIVQKRAEPPPNGISTPFTMGEATFFYTLENGTVFNYTGEPRDFELALKKHMPSYQIKQLDCHTGAEPPPKRFVGPRHEGDEGRGAPAEGAGDGAARPQLEKRKKVIPRSNGLSPGVSYSINQRRTRDQTWDKWNVKKIIELTIPRTWWAAIQGNLVNCLDDLGAVTDSVECLIRDLVADDKNKSPTTVRVVNGQCARIRCTDDDASL